MDSGNSKNNYDLVLAPFQPSTRVVLEVSLNKEKSTTSTLNVKNPTDQDITIHITKRPIPEKCVDLSFTETTIAAKDSAILYIHWKPKMCVTWWDILQLVDNNRNKYEVTLIMRSKDPPEKYLKTRIQKTINGSKIPQPKKLLTFKKEYLPTQNSNIQTQKKRPRGADSFQETIFETEPKHEKETSFKEKLKTKRPRKESFSLNSKLFNISTNRRRSLFKNRDSTKRSFLERVFRRDSRDKIVDQNYETGKVDETTPCEMIQVRDRILRRETFLSNDRFKRNSLERDLRRETFIIAPKCDNIETDINCNVTISPEKIGTHLELKLEMDKFSMFAGIVSSTPKSTSRSRRHRVKAADSEGRKNSDNGDNVDVKDGISDNLDDEKSIGDNLDDKDSISDSGKDTGSDKDNNNVNREDNDNDNSNNPNDNDSNNYFGNSLSVTVIPKFYEQETDKLSEKKISNIPVTDIRNIFPKRNCELPTKQNCELPVEELCETTEKDIDLLSITENGNVSMELPNCPKTEAREQNCQLPVEEKGDNSKEDLCPFGGSISPETENDDLAANCERSIKDSNPEGMDSLLEFCDTPESTKKLVDTESSWYDSNNSGLISPREKFGKNRKNSSWSSLLTTNKKNNESFSDPFLATTLIDDNWLTIQEQEFKKWLNALMTPPADFSETSAVDIGKIWQSVRTMNCDVLAESRESVSARYHTDTRLDTLRKAALKMYRDSKLTSTIASGMKCIDNGRVAIKKDTNPHLDIGLQKEIIALFMSYNPLWLRIGLETVYNERIVLKSNNDLVGITRFLLNRFFSDSVIVREHSLHSTDLRLEGFRSMMNNFILKTFLKFVSFLDHAKMNKLIGDDPCLFRKNSAHKESRMILVKFSSLVLGGIGDIIKVLRIAGYVVRHRQSYLEEFDYAVQDMHLDLRDGVRLCRVMEIVTNQKDLTRKCSVPAISKVQRIYNVKIALDALQQAGYVILGDIEPKNIAESHREKTLSLLWQILHKFYAPRYLKSAILLQNWWRRKIAYIRFQNALKMRKSAHIECCRKTMAAIKIQIWWRTKNQERERKNVTIFMQKFWKTRKLMLSQREQFDRLNEAFFPVQERWRTRQLEQKREKAAEIIQKRWRGYKIRSNFLAIKKATIFIQRKWRAKNLGHETREFMQERRDAVVKIQHFWRRIMVLKSRDKAATIIQQKWRAWKMMKTQRDRFLELKSAVTIVGNFWLCKKLPERGEFLKKRESCILIQQYWRSYQYGVNVRREFLEKKMATILIQRKLRAILLGRVERENLRKLHESAMKIQRFWRKFLFLQKEKKENEKRKIFNLNSEFSTKTLAHRLSESIDIFKMTSDLGRLSMCLASLDLITRLSNRSCIIVCNVGLVDKIYETLLRSNRSLPWIEASLRATSILINLAKYSPTKSFILKENYIEVLMRYLTVTVEKNVILFLHLATLMWVLIEDRDYAKAVLKNKRAVWLLKKLEDNVRRRKKTFPYAKETKVLPNSKPDWGLEQKEPRLFKDVYHATISIKNRLGKY